MYQNRIVLFLDILGFKRHVLDTLESSGQEQMDIPERISKLSECLTEMGEIAQIAPMVNDSMVTQFSDSIVLSFLGQDTEALRLTIDLVLQITVKLVECKIVCRGALSFGKLIHTDKLLFGPAMIDAYETESKAAMYPRVVMDKNIYNLVDLKNSENSLREKLNHNLDQKLQMDLDGKYYVDYFKGPLTFDFEDSRLIEYYKSLRSIIINGAKFQQPDLKVKYGWMKIKYNEFIKELNDNPDKFKISDKAFNTYFSTINQLKV